MKIGLTSSVAMHAVLIGFGLFSLSQPRPLDSSNFESFPVEVVPLEDISQTVQGESEAPVAETPAPEPTTREEPVEDARNIGDNEVDLSNPPTPDPKPREVETAAAPPPTDNPEPAPVEEPEPEPEPVDPPEPTPATEVAPEPAPAEEVTPEAAEEPAVVEEAPREMVELPSSAPSPQARPEPPQAQTARAPERQEPEEEPQREPEPQPSSEESDFNADQIAALLNREEASGGGAERSQQEAALGGRETTAAKLSQSEIDSLRSQVQRCWNPPIGIADAENMVVSIRLRLTPSGELDGNPEVVSGGGASMAERAAADAARRAVLRCAPYTAPADKYEAWADVQFNFDPRDMF